MSNLSTLTTYLVVAERIGRTHNPPAFVVEGADADALAEGIHRHAGKYLLSRDYDVVVNLEAMTGDIGWGRFGTFRLLEVDDTATDEQAAA